MPLAHQERPSPCVTISTAARWHLSGVAQRSPSGSDGGLGNRTHLTIGQAGGRFGCLLRGGGHTEKKKEEKKVVPLGLVAPPVLALVIARMFLITSDYQHERLLPEFARNRWTSVDC